MHISWASWTLPKLRHPAVVKLLATNIMFFPLVCFVLVLSALFESPRLLDIHVLGTGIQGWTPLVRAESGDTRM